MPPPPASQNTGRDYRRALEAEGLLGGAVDDVALLEVLCAVSSINCRFAAPPQLGDLLEHPQARARTIGRIRTSADRHPPVSAIAMAEPHGTGHAASSST